MNNKYMSHLSGSTDTPLMNMSIGSLLDRAVAQYPNNKAIISSHQNVRLSYTEFSQRVDVVAKNLLHLGLEKGDRIGIWSPNNIEWVTTLYAAAKAGLVLVNINPAYRTSELEYALNKVGCRALVLARSFKSSVYTEMINTLIPEISNFEPGKLEPERLPTLSSLILISDLPEPGYTLFSDLQIDDKSPIDLSFGECEISPHSPVNIQFTSGTTGAPKGATLTHHNIINNAYFVGRGINLSSTDKVCSPVPLYHCFGMVMATLACATVGATLILPDSSFDPLSTLKAVEQEACTALYGVPTMFSMILNHPKRQDFDVSSLRTGIVAGALCPEILMKQIISELNMNEVTNCYGMTETSPVSFQSATDDSLEVRTTTVGSVHPHVEVKIIDSDGKTLPRGVRGELCTKGYSVMQGYWDDPQRTEQAILDGWMHTGDEAIIDEEGYCSIVGRIKDTIIRGGENIAPKDIEEFLLTHPAIIGAQAFGVNDERYGEIVAVWLQLKDSTELNQEQVKEYCDGQIAHFKIPAIVKFVDEFPMTVTGKAQKFVMRAETEKSLKP